MAENSKIEWTDHTFNPWIGCTKVSPGCAHCYAEQLMETRLGRAKWGAYPRQRTSPTTWSKVRSWNRSARFLCACETEQDNLICPSCHLFTRRPRVFCASLADVFDPAVPDAWRDDLFELVAECRNLDWQILTKRPEIMRNYLLGTSGAGATNLEEGGCFDHVWLGVSVENQPCADERLPILLSMPARVRFASCEPLLEEIDISGYMTGILPDGPLNWVICGGESGPNARPMHPDWARSLRDQCDDSPVPFFFKQWGEWGSGFDLVEETRGVNGLKFFPEIERTFARVGKRAAGRVLDGRIHNEFPTP